jgi:branched-subunit amino acid transport protein
VTAELILVIAAITFGSRVLAMAVLPAVPPRLARLLDRMPAPLFAGLAVQALIGPDGWVAPPAVLAAAGGALVVSPWRSLPVCLVAGLAAWAVASLLVQVVA